MNDAITNTKIRISDTITINDKEVIVAKTMAISHLAPGFLEVTLTIFTEGFDVDWKKVPSDLEIIARDEMIADRAAEIENFAGDYIHGIPVGKDSLRLSMTLRIAQSALTPRTLIAACEHMIAKGVPENAPLSLNTEDISTRVSAVWLKGANHD